MDQDWSALGDSVNSGLSNPEDYRAAIAQAAAGVLEVPADRPRGVATARMESLEFRLDDPVAAAVFEMAGNAGCAPQTVLLTAWALLLSRLSGRDELLLGTDATIGSAGVDDAGARNALPLRLELSATTEVPAVIAGVQAQVEAMLANAPQSLDELESLLRHPSVSSSQPLFRQAFVCGDDVVLGADALRQAEMLLHVRQEGQGLAATLQYDAALFDVDTVRRYLRCWQHLFEGMAAAQAGTRLDAIPMLDAAAGREAIEFGNATEQAFESVAGVHRLFEAQAARTPDAIAVVHGERRLSYAELNERANRLARGLHQHGVGSDQRVAIYVERGIEVVLGMLAVLKAGGAYVPLDPTYPADRLAYTLADSEPRVLLTMSGMERPAAEALGELPAQLVVIDLCALPPEWAGLPSHDLGSEECAPDAEHLAYVLYTSGSTGQPKGVAMPHGPLVNLIQWQLREPGADAPLRTLQFAALGFDVAFQETFATLAAGGELHMVDQDTRLSGSDLFQFVRAHRIERLFLPYFALQMLAEGMESHLAASAGGESLQCELREIITAGEQLRIEPKIVRFFEQLPGCRLHNHYGPTETHVVTALTLTENPQDWPRLPTIGKPIANARVYVLDGQGNPVPRGVVGELYLAGPVLARGYLKRPEQSAERFLPDPFVGGRARMYRTGDLGRWLPDGTLEYLGRQDFQVKIRGYRIELGEIEAQLMAVPGVREAGVLAREDSPGLKRLVAYYSPRDPAESISVDALRSHLSAQLPEYMLPVAYVEMASLPLSPNGKLDRRALPAPGRQRPDWLGAYEPPQSDTEAALCRILAETLDLEKIGRHDNFFDLGGTSLLAARALEQIRREGIGRLSTLTLFRDPAPAALARALSEDTDAAPDARRLARGRAGDGHDDPIAIVAMAGRFPGADDVEAFWRNLCEGRDSITRFGPGELDASVPAGLRDDPDYVPARGVFDGYDLFDAGFFGISPREAELMDPQQRVFLELCWECIERAGHVPDAADNGPVGVFAGMYNASYFQRNVSAHPDLVERVGEFQVMLGNEKDYIATRVAHKLNLTGPAVSVHTACSTSLVAICQAVDSLRSGQCDMALAGGIAITHPVRSGYLYQEGAMLSPDGHTRSFDADAKGTVFSDGAAVVLLKRLSDALADGNPVFALIRGRALNNDGGNKASFTAPSSDGQAAVIAMAHADAGIDPRDVGYVETHGTATPVGDPIEVEGLTRAFRMQTTDRGFCRLGSVKSNVGHMLMAAGAASTIKTALALAEGRIPATVHYRQPNPHIDFEHSPFVVNAELHDWPAEPRQPRRAGVSSFGVGGTNAHVVMEQAPELPASDPASGPQLLVLSARTPAALEQAAERLAAHLQQDAEVNLADVAWTLAAGRKAFGHRLAVTASTAEEAVASLRSAETTSMAARSRPAHAGEVVFLFPGQGSQYAGMGRELYAREPAFREAFDACADALQDRMDLRALAFGDDAEALLPTEVMQPTIFAIEYSLARWWMAQGVEPVAMIGHSVGEFVAATLAGVFELADAMRLVATRGRMMQAQPAGAMLSVRLPLDALLPRLPSTLSLAAENAPGACVVAGPREDVAAFQKRLEAEDIACRALKTSHAFHSSMMDAVVEPFRAEVEAIVRHAPRLPIISTASGDWLDPEQAVSPEYWARHLREPVRFAAALSQLLQDELPSRCLLEVGPRTTLSTLSRQHPAVQKSRTVVVASLTDNSDDEPGSLLVAAGRLWCHGTGPDPAGFDRRSRRRRLRLPTYPFDRKRYWVEPAAAVGKIIPFPVAVSTPVPESSMSVPPATAAADRMPGLIAQLKDVFEDVAGFDLAEADEGANFIELGLDSLMLTQVALQLQKTFPVKITFRQLMGECSSLQSLAASLDAQLPAEAAAAVLSPVPAVASSLAAPVSPSPAVAVAVAMPGLQSGGAAASGDLVRDVIQQQMQLMAHQLALLGGQAATAVPATTATAAVPMQPEATTIPPPATNAAAPASGDEEAALAHTRYDVKKAFGAIARIDSAGGIELDAHQRERLDAFIQRYLARTPKSKAYTRQHRGHMADPRVVTGFRPLTKEIVYQIVVERSKGSHVWDIDGHEYVDALNGFGTSLFGWQPDFVIDAVKQQVDAGYEIGPMHPLAGEVSELICELTGHERAALCNTGSEAVLGAMRIARTVTGRETIAVFSGSYHGINDEVIVRGTKKLRAVPAAPGILRNTAEKVLVLDYGTPEALQVIRERAHELAAVLVEPVQSRRPDFQPVEFLKEVRKITAESGAALIFDEVITGFRSHPGGAQALFGIRADIATYGKVIGGGFPIGAMAGKREFMDALDGGAWDYGDDSIPTVGVTYFAGTFVRHPLTLAAARASLLHMKQSGAAMQQRLNERTAAMAGEINAFCAEVGAPVRIKHFASLWRTHFEEDHPLQDLLFAMMRSRGVHILDNFPCFFTTAHSEADFRAIIDAFKQSVMELQEAGFLPRHAANARTVMDASRPVVPGARLGRDPQGHPGWYVPDPEQPGQYLKAEGGA